MSKRVRGAGNPQALVVRHNFAVWTGKAGDAASARDQLAALLAVRQRVLGAGHPDILTTRQEIARWTEQAEEAKG
ncbi:tetratricopeptide repeat protein [Nonomuraea sp. NPDC003709]|uniref:tetratricopeptide repeat protein n=1 Tax=Nonomuraea sp. NPDC003709 TaxID=3154450 RepID=UPI0033B181CC